jgi:hypothetical protein
MAYTTIDDPSAYFQTMIYTGNGAVRSLTNDGNSDLQPDWIWIKRRDSTGNHMSIDSTRGVTKVVYPHIANLEETLSNRVTSFDSDGYSTANEDANTDTGTFVAWQWKANAGTTSSNSNGDITSTVQASSTAGFSIVTYTATATAGDTVGHGLSSQPEMIMVKKRAGGDAYGWGVWHTGLSNNNGTKQLILDTSAAEATQDMFNDAIFPSSSATVFATGQNNHTNFPSGATYVAYCFNSVQGYSKFGKYTGNNNASGPFVYTGFKPAWLMIKRTDNSEGWHIVDHKRDVNENNARLQAETNGGEDTSEGGLDMLSNGFKIKTTWAGFNADGGSYIYMVVAEHPFVSSKGVPTTAR